MPQSATARAAALLTWEDFAALDDEEELRGVELVDGVLEEGEVTTRKHGRIVSRLVSLLLAWVDAHGGGEILSQENRVRIGKRRVRKPDVFAVRASDKPRFDRETLISAPHLVVEILTHTRRDILRDRVTKLSDYESIGARHYWIVDPEGDTLEAYSLTRAGLYGPPRRYAGADLVRGDAFDMKGLRFRVRDLGR